MDAAALGRWLHRPEATSQFRLEQLQTYEVAGDGSDFARYLDGAPSWTPERKEPLLAALRLTTQRVHRHRVRVVTWPLTDYTRYECEWSYAPNAEAGEEIRIWDVADQGLPQAPHTDVDWWLTIERDGVAQVAVMDYDERTRFLGARLLPPGEVRTHVDTYRALWTGAEPFGAWWARHPAAARGSQHVR